jgi:hypothetical protein
MIKLIAIIVLTVFTCPIPGGGVNENATTEWESVLPDHIGGWKAVTGGTKRFDRETLYDYIDGGAELYLSYGFEKLISTSYIREGDTDIVVDVFDMKTSYNAYGVFTHSREVVESEFGQGSQYTEGLLLFWKGRYYVSILASPETKASKETAFELARIIENRIPTDGPLPGILELLPKDGLVEESVRFFRHYIWLNSHYYIADENILHIDENTDAVLAKYETGSRAPEDPERDILLIVRYPDVASARSAYASFVESYLPELNDRTVVRIEDGTWSGCRLDGEVISVVFNSRTERDALVLLEAVVGL